VSRLLLKVFLTALVLAPLHFSWGAVGIFLALSYPPCCWVIQSA
jgi:hypothetical protein